VFRRLKKWERSTDIMDTTSQDASKPVRIARFLNRRVIKTSYLRSTIYFLIAIGLFLLFYFFALYAPQFFGAAR
jgi:hypothetical protein